MNISLDHVRGSLFGAALGDAMGRRPEFMRLKDIWRAYGRHGRMSLPDPALFTDDTQMTLAVARALGAARFVTPRELVRVLTNEFDDWATYDPRRAPGNSCLTSIRNLRKARRWHKAWTVAPVYSLGCGANMRVAPTALLPHTGMAYRVSALQAALTHGHPLSIAATELTAVAIRRAVDTPLNLLPQTLLSHARAQSFLARYDHECLGALGDRWPGDPDTLTHDAWTHLVEVITKVIGVLRRAGEIQDVCSVLGEAWVADEALACALYFAVRYGDDPVLAISMASRTSGDSDSIACITGAIVGAARGTQAWPARWMDRIERRNDLLAAADVVVNFDH